MWLLLTLLVLCPFAWAGDEYGVPPPPPPPPVPYAPPVPQYPPANPGYHGHHHRDHSHSRSYSSSESDEECDDCEDLRSHCRGSYDGQCIRPKFRYVHHEEHHDRPGHKRQGKHHDRPRKQCRQVVISCPRDGQYSLESSGYHQFFKGQGFSLLAKCSRRGKWEARDLSGTKASFTRIRCVPQGTPGYPNAPAYPPLPQPEYQPVPPAYPADSQPPSPPVYQQ